MQHDPSSGAAFKAEFGLPLPAFLATARALADRGIFGLAWVGADLVTDARYGDLARDVVIGAPITETVPALLGLEEDIAGLRSGARRVLEIANIKLADAGDAAPRLNFTMLWCAGIDRYLLLISRVSSLADFEIALEQEVRRRKIAEEEVLRQAEAIGRANAELMQANRDLAEFAHVISHDLKAPMRALRYSTEDLERALADPAAGDPQAHLTRLRAQSRRMSSMLTGLLSYARLGRKTEALERTDTRALVTEILDSLPRPPGMRVVVEGDWPELTTLAALLDLVLRNLVENAIRHHDLSEGHLRLAARVTGEYLEIVVADDGPGIPSAWHEAVFQPFTTVDRSPGREQGGMGLAIVRRAVDVVGGTVRIVSDPAVRRGCEFQVRWPLGPSVAAGRRTEGGTR